MLTLYHAPVSRSSRLVQLVHELGVADRVDIRIVSVDENAPASARSPHPEGKVPFLVHDGVEIRESNAIILYLCDLFPEAGLGPQVGDRDRGRFLSWLAWYGNVVEPVIVTGAAGLSHPLLDLTFRGMPDISARLAEALADAPYLMGERYTAADLLLVSPFAWFADALPDDPNVRDWFARCMDRPALKQVAEADARHKAKAA
ncbi:glutathione S-transferase [Rhodobacterales bacterium HKCCE4037]|nr:glutathione S-transferase [Rhodobacterales bacterium HKCCE4037]